MRQSWGQLHTRSTPGTNAGQLAFNFATTGRPRAGVCLSPHLWSAKRAFEISVFDHTCIAWSQAYLMTARHGQQVVHPPA